MRCHALIRFFQRSPDAALLQPDPARMRRMQWQVFLAITLGCGWMWTGAAVLSCLLALLLWQPVRRRQVQPC